MASPGYHASSKTSVATNRSGRTTSAIHPTHPHLFSAAVLPPHVPKLFRRSTNQSRTPASTVRPAADPSPHRLPLGVSIKHQLARRIEHPRHRDFAVTRALIVKVSLFFIAVSFFSLKSISFCLRPHRCLSFRTGPKPGGVPLSFCAVRVFLAPRRRSRPCNVQQQQIQPSRTALSRTAGKCRAIPSPLAAGHASNSHGPRCARLPREMGRSR